MHDLIHTEFIVPMCSIFHLFDTFTLPGLRDQLEERQECDSENDKEEAEAQVSWLGAHRH